MEINKVGKGTNFNFKCCHGQDLTANLYADKYRINGAGNRSSYTYNGVLAGEKCVINRGCLTIKRDIFGYQ